MKLSIVEHIALCDSKSVMIESDEGPLWDFDYSNYHNDPHPSVLILGAYTHPSTGNNLIGGINLNYLTQEQRDRVARELPKIMHAHNLYERYQIGKRVLPDIFQNKYRTYDAANINNVSSRIFYPIGGMIDSTLDLIKTKVDNLQKTDAERVTDLQPDYQPDLADMNDALAKTTKQFNPQAVTQPSSTDLERQEEIPFDVAKDNYDKHQLQNNQTTPQEVSIQPQNYTTSKPQPNNQKISLPPPPKKKRQIPAKKQKPQLTRPPAPQQDLISNETEKQEDLEESIRYYCHTKKKYIVESINLSHISLEDRLYNLRDSIRHDVQNLYDDWYQDEYDTNGLCDQISDVIGSILSHNDINHTEGGHDGDDHSYIIAYDDTDTFIVDIHPSVYEIGGGYSWKKIDNVVFTVDDIEIIETHRPDWI